MTRKRSLDGKLQRVDCGCSPIFAKFYIPEVYRVHVICKDTYDI